MCAHAWRAHVDLYVNVPRWHAAALAGAGTPQPLAARARAPAQQARTVSARKDMTVAQTVRKAPKTDARSFFTPVRTIDERVLLQALLGELGQQTPRGNWKVDYEQMLIRWSTEVELALKDGTCRRIYPKTVTALKLGVQQLGQDLVTRESQAMADTVLDMMAAGLEPPHYEHDVFSMLSDGDDVFSMHADGAQLPLATTSGSMNAMPAQPMASYTASLAPEVQAEPSHSGPMPLAAAAAAAAAYAAAAVGGMPLATNIYTPPADPSIQAPAGGMLPSGVGAGGMLPPGIGALDGGAYAGAGGAGMPMQARGGRGGRAGGVGTGRGGRGVRKTCRPCKDAGDNNPGTKKHWEACEWCMPCWQGGRKRKREDGKGHQVVLVRRAECLVHQLPTQVGAGGDGLDGDEEEQEDDV